MKKFIKFIKNLSDGGLAEDMYAAMERILDEDTNKEKMVNKQEFIAKTISYFTPILKTYCSEECVKELIDEFVNSMDE